MSLIRKHGAVLQAWACLALVLHFYSGLVWATVSAPFSPVPFVPSICSLLLLLSLNGIK